MPSVYREYGELWQDMNPAWEVRLWSEQDVEDMGLINRDVWDNVKSNGAVADTLRSPAAARATQMADVAGYEIINRFGGVYINTDMEPLRSLSNISVKESDAWAVQEIDHWVNNGVLGGPAGHSFWQTVIEELPNRFYGMPDSPMHITTGPHLLTAVHDWCDGLLVLPRHLFNFASYEDVVVGGNASLFKQAAYDAGAIALHHWAHRSDAMR